MVICMKYHYRYQTTAWDFFRLSIYCTYSSMIGVCNIIFTVAMILLTLKMWTTSSAVIKAVLILACIAFPVIQPISLFQRARNQAASQKKNMEIGFDDVGIHVTAGEESSDVEWNAVRRIAKKPGMIILFPDAMHGYMMTDRMLGADKQEFYQFVLEKTNLGK